MIYLAVGLAAWLHSPLDVRTRVFFAFAVANGVAFGLPAAGWFWGFSDPLQFARWKVAVLLAALGVGALLLLHFLQLFPRRRPWIRRAPWVLRIGYLATPPIVAGLIAAWPADVSTMSTSYIVALLTIGLPWGLVLAVVVPIAGILSLLKSYHEVRTHGPARLKTPLLCMLISQVAGGALTLVFAPVLALIAPSTGVQNGMTIAIWTLGLLTPIAFAAAVWRYDVLSVPVD